MKPINYVLRKMCQSVDVDWKKVDFQERDWYWKHTWTIEDQNEFKTWLSDLLYTDTKVRNQIMQHPIRNKTICRKTADWFVFQYGWKIT